MNGAAGEPELYRYVMQSFQIFGQAVSSNLARNIEDRETVGGAAPTGENSEPNFEPQAVADAMASAWDKINFRPLEEIAER